MRDVVVGSDAAPKLDEAEIGRIFREDSGRSVATLIRIFGDIDVAEDAVQEAFAVALRKWPRDGLPPNPGGWIRVQGELPTGEQLPFESSLSLLDVRDVELADDPQRARDPGRYDPQQHEDQYP